MADKLKGRLARIRKLGLARASELERSDQNENDDATLGRPPAHAASRASTGRRERPGFLEGWEGVGAMAWTRTLRFDGCLPNSIDPAVFAPLRRLRTSRLSAAVPGPATVPGPEAESRASLRIEAERLRFFDLETTGLSGGTGTIAFLAAVGRVVDGEFELTQVFLEDYPGEAAFLSTLLPLLEGGAIVSYNGKAFDLPLLRTRCVMNGIAAPVPALHIDALYASRRLWKRVYGGASLGLLEREVLGVERPEDVPGALIPEAWLSFARGGDGKLMRLVLSHNADDVVGLAKLLARSQGIFDEPRRFLARSDVDRAGLGRSLLAVGRTGDGEELLEAAAGDGDERAGILLSRRYRVSKRVEDGVRVAAMLPATYRSAVERAKTGEHLSGDLIEATRWANEALRLAPGEAEARSAGSRIARLERMLARK